jgi:hypothetical protein
VFTQDFYGFYGTAKKKFWFCVLTETMVKEKI